MSEGHVFLSYAKEDWDRASRLHMRLLAHGIRLWVDQHELLPGQEWESAIRVAIRQSSAFVVLLSKYAVDKKGYIQKEIREGLEVAEQMPQGRLFIIPVRLEECGVPEVLRRYQWLDLFRRGGYNRLRDTLSRHLGLSHRQQVPLEAERPAAFASPVDHLLFNLFHESGRFLYLRADRNHFLLSQGHFLVVRKGSLAPFQGLRGTLADFRRLPPEVRESLLPSKAAWRRSAALLRRIILDPDAANARGPSTFLESEERICAVDATYWQLATLFAPGANVYLSGDLDPIYFEVAGVPKMLVMPVRMDDEDKARVRTLAGRCAGGNNLGEAQVSDSAERGAAGEYAKVDDQ